MSRDDGRPQRGSGRGGQTNAPRWAKQPPREDPLARRTAEIVRTTGLTPEAARQVAAGRADLNELLKRMAFQDEVTSLMARHELNRALATQIALGQASLEQVLSRRRVEALLASTRDRSTLDAAAASGKELTIGVHGRKHLRVTLTTVDQYEVVYKDLETGVEARVHKLQIKYAWSPDDHKKVRKALDYDKARRDGAVEPVSRPQDRYACSDRRLGLAVDRKVHVTVTTIEGERFSGEIAWVARYEFGLKTRAGAEVVIFRHCLADLQEA